MRSMKFHALRTVVLVFFPVMAAALTPTPSPTSIPELPDLVLWEFWIETENRENCTSSTNQRGVRIQVKNTGTADAGPFRVYLNGEMHNVPFGLPSGATVSLFTVGEIEWDSGIAIDFYDEVEESVEFDNDLPIRGDIPTLLPTCSPTFTYAQSDYDRTGWVDPTDLLLFSLIWYEITGPSVSDHSRVQSNSRIDSLDLIALLLEWHGGRYPTPTPTLTPTLTPTPTRATIQIDIPDLPAYLGPLRMVKIEPGGFWMGSPESEMDRNDNEGPLHWVSIDYEFYVGETEITDIQWKSVMGYSLANQPSIPVFNVSWDDITGPDGFLDRLNSLGQGTFRLPTEAEWEYVCRAGTQTRFFFGDSLSCEGTPFLLRLYQDCPAGGFPGPRSLYMYWGRLGIEPSPIHALSGARVNQFGVCDTSGNVEEWCQDTYHPNYDQAPTDGSAWVEGGEGRVLRGGNYKDRSIVKTLRSASRNYAPAYTRSHLIGFRVVMEINPPHK